MKNPLLEVKNLHTYFFTNKGTIKAVQGVDFTIEAGKTLGIVGESGSGKSITAFSILNLLEYPGKIVQGEINFGGVNLVNLGKKEIRKIRGNDISMRKTAKRALNSSSAHVKKRSMGCRHRPFTRSKNP